MMTKEIKLKIKGLEERRKLLCQECDELEEEVRILEDEIEEIDEQISELERGE